MYRVNGEVAASGGVEILDSAYEPEIALLYKVEEDQSLAPVVSGSRYDQTQIGLDKALLRA